MKKIFIAAGVIVVLIIVFIGYLFFTNEGVATEFRQFQQPRPNEFFIGIDVSATIDPYMLDTLKRSIIDRLRMFIGDTSVSYGISVFGKPGCGLRSVEQIVQTTSPRDETTFEYEVVKKIESISVTGVDPKDTRTVTTPLYCLLDYVLRNRKGGRIIIFSDLMNDDSDCKRSYYFPEDTLKEFGQDKSGQLVFLYPTPLLSQTDTGFNETILSRQEKFIDQMQALRNSGDARAYFYHIPDNPENRDDFIHSKLTEAIPVTQYEIIREKVSKAFNTIVSAVRG